MLMAYSYTLYGPFMPFMASSMYTRTNSPLHINTGSYTQSVITYNKHSLASILNSIVSSVLSHWVLPHYAVVSAPFEK